MIVYYRAQFSFLKADPTTTSSTLFYKVAIHFDLQGIPISWLESMFQLHDRFCCKAVVVNQWEHLPTAKMPVAGQV